MDGPLVLSVVMACLVLRVADGDTLTAQCPHQPPMKSAAPWPLPVKVKVRLAEIDAPEKGQAFGQRSKRALEQLCLGRMAQVRATESDRYGRWVAHVQCQGLDVNAQQVRSGMAWVYERYAQDPQLPRLQQQAQAQRQGLWVQARPTPPWTFRQQRKAPKSPPP